ncbi:MAG: SDR family NAD(P)-dependent oxidoreductase [Pseudomonadota bacterium]
MKPLVIVAGAGTGLGQALLSRFERGGFNAVGLGRSAPDAAFGIFKKLDLSDQAAVTEAFAELSAEYGTPKVVIHNTAELVIKPFMETTVDDFQRTWASMVKPAVLLAQAVFPKMVEAGGGSFIVSGATASLRGGSRFSAFASAKFALRGVTQSLAREYQSQGIHVCHAILDGIIDTAKSRELHGMEPEKMMRPEDIAEAYWQIAHQPHSTWTHELDLRPASESF